VTYVIRAGGFWLMAMFFDATRSVLNALPGSVIAAIIVRCAAVPLRLLRSSPCSWSWLSVETIFWRSFAEWVAQY